MFRFKEKIETWLRRPAFYVGEGEILTAFSMIEILGGWKERPLGIGDESNLYVVYVVAKDADPRASIGVGFVEGMTMEILQKELIDKFKINKWSGFYFWLIPAVTRSEAYEIACVIWHDYFQAKSGENHPRHPEGLQCLYCDYL